MDACCCYEVLACRVELREYILMRIVNFQFISNMSRSLSFVTNKEINQER